MELHPKYQLVLLVCVLLLPALCLSQFTNASATFYTTSDGGGTPTGGCGFGDYGRTENSGRVTGVSQALFRGGAGCGACYQVRCTDPQLCRPNGAIVAVTDSGGNDFVMSLNGFNALGVNPSASEQLRRKGNVNVEYMRVSCAFNGSTVKIRVYEGSRFPEYLAIGVVYIPGTNDVVSVQISNDNGATWITLGRAFGGVFDIPTPPRGPFKVRVRFSGSQNWVESPNTVIPANWNVGDIYDTGIRAVGFFYAGNEYGYIKYIL